MRHSFSLTCAVPLSGGHRTETSQAEVTRQAEYQYLPDTTAHNRAGTGMSAGPFFTHGAAGLRPSVSSNPALSGFHSVQEKSEARWMYERLLAFYIRLPENKNKKFLLELCRTGIKDAMPHIPDSVVSVSAF